MEKLIYCFKNFFRRKSAGFYVSAAGAVLSLVCAIIYAAGFTGNRILSDYMSWGAFALLLLAFFAFTGLTLFRRTSAWASPVMGVLAFIAFILFVADGYMYFSEIFYGGVTMEAFSSIEPVYLISMLSMLIIIILGNVGVYLKQEKVKEKSSGQGKEVRI